MAGPEHKAVSPMGGVKAFSCPNCGGQVALRAPGQTLSAACQHCTAVIDLSDENLRILQKANNKMTHKPVIPIGQRGKMFGQDWEVVGFMVRKAFGFEYYWEEYLLFNPWYGFRWLINNYGHWGFVTPLMDLPDYNTGARTAKYEGKRYRMFARGGASVEFVLGEFYWKVKRGDNAKTTDLVNPPHMLSYENDGSSSSWSYTIYLEPKVVKEAFKLKSMPFRRRVGANQPNKAKENWKSIRWIYFALLALVITMQIFFVGSASDKTVLQDMAIFSRDRPEWVSPPFNLEGKKSNVQVFFRSPSLGNSWIYIDGYLHNKGENKNYGFNKEWEYYYGRDGGESWTEGSRGADAVLNSIPSGEYELVLNARLGGTGLAIDVKLNRDVPFFANFWMILLAISVLPIWFLFKSIVFEKSRWEEADA